MLRLTSSPRRSEEGRPSCRSRKRSTQQLLGVARKFFATLRHLATDDFNEVLGLRGQVFGGIVLKAPYLPGKIECPRVGVLKPYRDDGVLPETSPELI